jgi:hypothetical protein
MIAVEECYFFNLFFSASKGEGAVIYNLATPIRS